MLLRTSYFRCLTGCLAILGSLLGGLQQSHGLCEWVECRSACSEQQTAEHATCHNQKQCECCQDSHSKCQCNDSQHPAESEIVAQEQLGHHSQLPCQQRCWCCQPAAPQILPTDSSYSTRELIAPLQLEPLFSAELQLYSSIFVRSGEIHPDSFALSAAQRCAQFCRLLI